MKKPFSLLLTITLTASAFINTVFAAPVIDNPTIDDNTGIVTVSGSISDGRYGDPVTIFVVEDNWNHGDAEWSDSYFITNIKAYRETTLDNQLKFSEELGLSGFEMGEFDIYVSANGETVKYDYFYADKQSKIDFVRGTTAADDDLGVAEIICQTGKTDSALILELKQKLSLENAQSTAAKLFGITENNIILNVDNDNFTSILFNLLKEKEEANAGSLALLEPSEFVEIMNLAASIETVNDGSENIMAYEVLFGLDADFVKTYTDNEIDNTDFINYTKGNGLKSIQDAKDCFKTAVVEYLIVNAEGWNDYLSLIESHGTYIGIDMEKYDLLDNKAKITNYITTYTNVNSFKEAVNKAIKTIYEKENSKDSGSGGGTIASKPSIVVGGDISTPPVPLDQTAVKPQFNDVSSEHWSYEAVEYLSKKGIISGAGNGNFEPDRTVLREEFVKILVLGLGLVPKNEVADFSDLKAGEWYNEYIAAAVDAGFINGVSDTEFGIGQTVSRQDAATMIFRAAKLSKVEEPKLFADDVNISYYAKDGVYALKQMGIINGVGDDKFEPAGVCTRAQTAKMIYEYIMRGE